MKDGHLIIDKPSIRSDKVDKNEIKSTAMSQLSIGKNGIDKSRHWSENMELGQHENHQILFLLRENAKQKQ